MTRSIAACLALAGVYGIVVLAWGWIWGYYELNLYTQIGAESIHPGDSMYTISEAGFAGIFDLPWGVAPDWAGIARYHLPNSVLSGLFVVAPFLLVYRLGLMRVFRYRALWALAIAVLLGFGYGALSDFALAREEPDVVRMSWKVPCMVAMFACGVVLLAWESRGGRTAPGRVASKTLCALLCVAVFATVGVAEPPAEREPTSRFADAAARELGEWGDAAKGALPRLRKLREEEERLTAAIAAARIGSDEDVERAIELARGRAMLERFATDAIRKIEAPTDRREK